MTAGRGLALLSAVGLAVAGCGTSPAEHRYPPRSPVRTATTQFDAGLLRIPFPARIERTARAMVRANRARIALTEHQARVGSLASMRGLDGRHRAADAAVEAQVRLIRMFLRLPPPSTS